MKKQLLIIVTILGFVSGLNAQVGVNATGAAPNPSAMLDVNSTSKGLLIPRMTTVQKNAIATKPTGLMVFDITLNQFSYWNGSTWIDVSGASSGGNQWSSGSGNIFTTNVNDNVGIGTNNPTAKLKVKADFVGYEQETLDGSANFHIKLTAGAAQLRTTTATDVWLSAGRLLPDFRIQYSNGNVGIGLPNIDEKLTINTALSNYGMLHSGGAVSVGSYTGSVIGGGLIGAYGTKSNHDLGFFTNGGAYRMIIKNNGKIGIGTNDPGAALEVNEYFNSTVGSGYFLYTTNPPGFLFETVVASRPLSIIANAGILSKTFIASASNVTSSDNRIKKDFSLSNNSEDLERLKKIQITNYRMKDVVTWGTQTFKKVIAQQVEQIYPEVIKLQTSVIPDIYALAESVVYDALNKKLNVSLSKDYGIKIGDKIELVHPENGKIQAEVVEVSGKSFTVKNWEYATDKIFVFGREVNDFRSVDYEALSMLGISAIQQLAKEIEDLKKTNSELNKVNEKNETRFQALESALKTLLPSGK
jgi:hypothetical protein